MWLITDDESWGKIDVAADTFHKCSNINIHINKHCCYSGTGTLRAVLWAVQLVRSHRAPRRTESKPPNLPPVTRSQTDQGGPHSIPRTGPRVSQGRPWVHCTVGGGIYLPLHYFKGVQTCSWRVTILQSLAPSRPGSTGGASG